MGPLRRLGGRGGSPGLKPERGLAPAPPPELRAPRSPWSPSPARRASFSELETLVSGLHSDPCKSCCPAHQDALRPVASASFPCPGPGLDLGYVGGTHICR